MYGWNKVNKQGKIKRQTHSCDCQTTTNPLIKSTDFYFNINCTKLKIDSIGIDACIEEIRKKRLFPKTGAGGDKRKTMKETISSLHLEIESLKEQLRHQREHFEQQHENQLTVTRNQSHELAHKNTQLSMKDAEINDKNIEIKGIKRALETRCAQTRNAERNNVNLMNANSDLAKKLEESEKINKKLRENTDHGQTVADVGVDSSAGVIHSDTGINPRVPEFSGIGPIQSANEDTTVNFLNINMNEFNMENSISQNTDMEILSDEMSKTSINDISQMVSFTFGGSNQSNQRI